MSALTGVHLDGFMQADSALEGDEILEAVTYATNQHLSYQFVPNQFGLYAVNSSVTALAGVPMVEIRLTPLDGWGRIVKRAFDFLAALAGLIVLSPVFLIITAIMLATDPGPVFYRHTRLARSGKNVRVLKFRSMQWKYCTGPKRPFKTAEEVFAAMGRQDLIEQFQRDMKVEDDPRVTRLGKFLRKTSLDELPQLLNVLHGDMSLVGPRPILAAELERYGTGAPTFLALKPGITGLWQISGRNDISYEERVKLDIFYVENWSIWMDIKIILKTAWSVMASRGAY
jgi:exopolysaccharide biosynthesis polyprenyl glycosylphosphotransferase